MDIMCIENTEFYQIKLLELLVGWISLDESIKPGPLLQIYEENGRGDAEK